jgi:type I restriction enzyme R subunit
MPAPGEHKTTCLCVPARSLVGGSARRQVQARIPTYAQEIGWAYVPRDEAERRRGFTFTTSICRN